MKAIAGSGAHIERFDGNEKKAGTRFTAHD